MKRYIWGLMIMTTLLVFPFYGGAVDWLAQADKIFDQGGLENYKKSISVYKKAAKKLTEDYEAA